MGIKATEMKKGMVLSIDGNPSQVMDYQHVKLGKGGAVLQTKLKNIVDGTIVTKRIRSEETLEQVFMDKQAYEYLYSSGTNMSLCTGKTTSRSIWGMIYSSMEPNTVSPIPTWRYIFWTASP